MSIPTWQVSKAKLFNRKYEAELEVRGGRAQTKKPSVGRVWIFSGTTQCSRRIYVTG